MSLYTSNNLARSSASTASLAQARSTLNALAEPAPHALDARTYEYLTIELVWTIIESTAHATARQSERRQRFDLDASGTDDEEELRKRLDGIGFRIGWALAERLSRDRPPMSRPTIEGTSLPPPETLEVIKFICKDIWASLYDKQIDNLRTNHRGTWVLQDSQHKPIMRLSSTDDHAAARLHALRMLYLPCGVIRGAAACLGLQCTVQPELGGAGQVTFSCKTTR